MGLTSLEQPVKSRTCTNFYMIAALKTQSLIFSQSRMSLGNVFLVGNVKLMFKELSTLLTQIEGCLNSRPLVPFHGDDDGIEALTPGHFLIGRPLQALPDNPFIYCDSISLFRRWRLCQALLLHFWKEMVHRVCYLHREIHEVASPLEEYCSW